MTFNRRLPRIWRRIVARIIVNALQRPVDLGYSKLGFGEDSRALFGQRNSRFIPVHRYGERQFVRLQRRHCFVELTKELLEIRLVVPSIHVQSYPLVPVVWTMIPPSRMRILITSSRSTIALIEVKRSPLSGSSITA